MVKYVDAGYEDPASSGGKKKKSKKGFKVDRRANYERMMARKLTGKDAKKPAEKRPTRVKSVVFDDSARKEYLLTLHKKKNERRVQAFVDVKRKMRKDNARTRQQQREEARRAYNNYAKIPILPNYTFQLPNYVDRAFDGNDEEEEETEERPEDEEVHSAASSSSSSDGDVSESGDGEQGRAAWVYMGDEDGEGNSAEEARREALLSEKRRLRKLTTKATSTHAMPASMTGAPAEELSGMGGIDDSTVTVEVKPLFGGHPAPSSAGGRKAVSALPSQNFSDLPAVVEQELRRLRQETKGPARTKSKVHMMKELEKIRKIKKHSRKGHGKRKASGKRKNRRK